MPDRGAAPVPSPPPPAGRWRGQGKNGRHGQGADPGGGDPGGLHDGGPDRVLAHGQRTGHPDRLRVRRLRPGKRRHGLDQDQQGQGGGGRQNKRERPPGRAHRPAHRAGGTPGRGPVREAYK